MQVQTCIGWTAVVLFTLVHHIFASYKYGVYNNNGPQNINSPQIAVQVKVHGSSAGKCQYKVVGRGVEDNFEDDCAAVINDYIQINVDNYYAYFYQDYQPLGMYTDTFGTLVLIKGDGCRLRTYKTSSRQVKPAESMMSSEVCNNIKNRLAAETVLLNDYWAKWEVNFETKNPGDLVDPLKDQPRTASLYDGRPGVTVSTSSTNMKPVPTFNLYSQPLTPSLPAQTTTPATQPAGPTILGVGSIETDSEDSINSAIFGAYNNMFNNGNQCTLEQCVEGYGVHDCFKISCQENNPSSILSKGLLLWGHPDFHPFSIFSDSRATLYLFERGWCTKKTYTTTNRVTTSKAELLSSTDCAKAKQEMKNTLKKRGVTMNPSGTYSIGHPMPVDSSDNAMSAASTHTGAGSLPPQLPTPITNVNAVSTPSVPVQPLSVSLTPQPLTPSLSAQQVTPSTQGGGRTILGVNSIGIKNENVINDPSFNTYNNKYKNGNQCVFEKCVKGNGVHDCFKMPCQENPPTSVIHKGLVIWGHPDLNQFSFFSDERATLYLFEGGWCTKKTYTTSNRVTTSRAEVLSPADCAQARKKLDDGLKNRGMTMDPYGTFSFGSPMPVDSSHHVTRPISTPAGVGVLPSQPMTPSNNLNSVASFSQSESPGATPAESATTTDLQQFVPKYPSTLGNKGTNSKYEMNVNMNINSYNVPGCNFYITASGKGVNDHFQLPCSNEQTKSLSDSDFMLFGSPTSTLGLFSDTPSTLIIMTHGTCYKKTYGPTPTGPSLMGGSECEEVKRRMLNRMNTNGNDRVGFSNGGMVIHGNNNRIIRGSSNPSSHQIGHVGSGSSVIVGDNNQVTDASFDGSDSDEYPNINYSPNGHTSSGITTGNNYHSTTSPAFGQQGNPFSAGFPFGPGGVFGNQPAMVIQPFNNPQPAMPSSNNLGVTWRNGDYSSIYNGSPTITVSKNNDGPYGCTMSVTIMGRGINDEIMGSCSEMGTNILQTTSSSSIAIADPSTSSGLYADGWTSLVVIKNGQCTKRKYKSSATDNNTKITASPADRAKCDKAKRKISSMLGGNYG